MNRTPTGQTYSTFDEAFDHFNVTLFGGSLPDCLITVQRQRGAYGYFSGNRFGRVGGGEIVHEIAMNPAHFNSRPVKETLSTLAHEMAHLWQSENGKPSRTGYHNKEWAEKMKEIGLHPSDTAAPGGKETGQRVSHYIVAGGPFDRACTAWLEQNPAPLYHDRAGDGEEAKKAKKKSSTRTKYTCPDCQAAAWGKPSLNIMCGDCEITMPADEDEEG